jgi:hypothetical protein
VATNETRRPMLRPQAPKTRPPSAAGVREGVTMEADWQGGRVGTSGDRSAARPALSWCRSRPEVRPLSRGDAHPREAHYNEAMASAPLIAHVKNGRLVLDVPTTLPEGAAVELHADAELEDDLDPEERARLLEELEEAAQEIERGEHDDAFEYLAQLRARSEAANR